MAATAVTPSTSSVPFMTSGMHDEEDRHESSRRKIQSGPAAAFARSSLATPSAHYQTSSPTGAHASSPPPTPDDLGSPMEDSRGSTSGIKRGLQGFLGALKRTPTQDAPVAKFAKSRRTNLAHRQGTSPPTIPETQFASFSNGHRGRLPRIEQLSGYNRKLSDDSMHLSADRHASPRSPSPSHEGGDPLMARSSVAEGDFDFSAASFFGAYSSLSPHNEEPHYLRPNRMHCVRIHANRKLYEAQILRKISLASDPTGHTWLKLYAVLVGNILHFYKSEESKDVVERLHLAECRMDALSWLDLKQWHISGGSGGISEYFRAETDQAMRDWVAAIGTAASARIIPAVTKPAGTLTFSRDQPATRIVLVRHGHYINSGSKASDAEKVLSEMGRAQAQLTAESLQKMGYHNRNRSVIIAHSTLSRATESADIIASGFGDDLLEGSDLLVEGWPGQPFPKQFVEEGDDQTSPPVFSERFQVKQMVECLRLLKAFHTYFVREADEPDDMLVIIVCHANIIRYFICKVLGIPYVGVWGQMEIHHCSQTRVDIYNDGTMKLISMNEVGHLPENLQTTSKDHI